MEEKQLFRDVAIKPNSDNIAFGLGLANDAYVGFLDRIKDHDIELVWNYYNDGKAWLGKGLYKWKTTRGTEKEMTALWLSLLEGFFRVAIYIPEKYRFETMSLPLSTSMKEKIADSKQIGKLKFFPVVFDLSSDELLDEIITIVDYKKTLK